MKGMGKDTVWSGLRTEFCSDRGACSEAFFCTQHSLMKLIGVPVGSSLNLLCKCEALSDSVIP